MGLNHPFNPEGTGLTVEQFDTIIDKLLAPEPPATSDEVQIAKTQINYLDETRFKPIEVE